nr:MULTISPECIES: PfkB family carbohydrate kinase [Lactonifactor]
MVKEEGYYTPVPKLSTGGGDNFNAGLCFGLLQGLPLAESLRLGNATSGYYVRTGESPDVYRLYEFMQGYTKLERAGE